MSDYEPLDISQHFNGGLDALGGDAAEIGPRHFRGLPFAIGANPDRCFISLDGNGEPVEVPVSRTASVLSSLTGCLKPKSTKAALLASMSQTTSSRCRTDRNMSSLSGSASRLASSPTDSFRGPSGLPFLAVTDGKHRLFPRQMKGSGRKSDARQTEYLQATARSYFLWSWANPEPDSAVESIRIVPKGPAFVIAAVTLSHLDEHPFARQGRREAKITITDPVAASSPFDLEVQVDRGDTTYAFPLPRDPGDGFLNGYHRGFGEANNDEASPAYAEISAVPSATVSIKQGGESIAHLLGVKSRTRAKRKRPGRASN